MPAVRSRASCWQLSWSTRPATFGEEISEPLVDVLGWVATAILVAGGTITSLALLGDAPN